MHFLNKYIFFFLACIAFIQTQLLIESGDTYKGYLEILPSRSSSCYLIEPSGPQKESRVLFITAKKEDARNNNDTYSVVEDECRVLTKVQGGDVLEISYFITSINDTPSKNASLNITIYNNSKQAYHLKNLTGDTSNTWSKTFLKVPDNWKDNTYSLLLKLNSSAETDHALIRSRLNIFSERPPSLTTFNYHFKGKQLISIILKTCSAFLVVFFFLKTRNRTWLIATFLSTLSFHFYKEPFFYFDEWHVLQRFSELGFSGVIYTHNEHFLPLYFIWQYINAVILQNNYWAHIIVSISLSVIYMKAIELLLFTLTKHSSLSRLLSFLFILSAVHGEAMQWVFEQSMILSGIVGLLGINYAIVYMQEGEKKQRIYSAILIGSAPLFFGTGFLYSIITGIGLLLLYPSLIIYNGSIKIYLDRFARWVATTFVTVSLAAILYYINKDSSGGHGVSSISITESIANILNYTIVGVGIGTVLRSLCLYPSLSMSTIYDSCNAIGSDLCVSLLRQIVSLGCSAESFLGALSIAVLLLIIIITLKKSQQDFFLAAWGFIFMCIFFIFIGIGRAQHGELQSLALRYQYHALVGFILILAVLLKNIKIEKLGNLKYYILILWLLTQSVLLESFTYFRSRGVVHRSYVTASSTWIESDAKKSKTTRSYPLHKATITPGRSLLDITKTYHWLKD